MKEPSIQTQPSCDDDYDPESLTCEAALQRLLDAVTPLDGQERVHVRGALGRVLAEPVIARFDVPAHTNSAMDGYAVSSADLPAEGINELQVVGASFAGKPFRAALARGEAIRIMTGAVVPDGADTILIQEKVEAHDGRIRFAAGPRRGQHVRAAGEDLKAGAAAFTPGRRLSAADIGVIASLGIAEVAVLRRPRVAFFSTGDELCSIGRPLADGEVYDSNRYTIFGMLTRLGCEVLDLGVVRDDSASLEAAFRDATAAADVVITSGGVSVGEADFVKPLMAKLGEVLFWKIAMKPGRPMAFGRIGGGERAAWLFGLPGNPVAVMAAFYQFVRDALYVLMGADPAPAVPLLPAVSSVAMRKAPGRTEFQRGIVSQVDGQSCVRPAGGQGSGVLRSMSEANCFIVLEHDRGQVAVGDLVQVQLFDGLV